MLHTTTVEEETFRLLVTLMKDSRLAGHDLVGGTALALLLGHRKSIDLDLFTPKPFDENSLERYLSDRYKFKVETKFKNTLMGFINNIKVDFMAHQYPYLEGPIITKEGIRIVSIKDITAMKLNAIYDSGTRLKDFVDIAYLSTKLSFNDMLKAYDMKYKTKNTMILVRSLTYFKELNFDVDIQMIDVKLDWRKIEKRLNEMVKNNNKIFHSPPLDHQ